MAKQNHLQALLIVALRSRAGFSTKTDLELARCFKTSRRTISRTLKMLSSRGLVIVKVTKSKTPFGWSNRREILAEVRR